MSTQSDANSTPRRYLVAWGGDKPSADALALGAVLANTFKAELHALYVLQEESMLGIQHIGAEDFRRHVEKAAREELEQATMKLPEGIPLQVSVRRSPSITSGILDFADEIGARMIIIGAGSRAGGVLTNPVANALLHASPVSIAMAPKGYRKEQFTTLEELVVAVGIRSGAQTVIEEGVSAAVRVGLPLRLVSFVESDIQTGGGDATRTEGARAHLEEAEEEVGGRVPVSTELSKGKNIADAIKSIKWKPRSALLLGSSRLAPGRQTFLGRTATRILGHLPVPMIIIPRKEVENRQRNS